MRGAEAQTALSASGFSSTLGVLVKVKGTRMRRRDRRSIVPTHNRDGERLAHYTWNLWVCASSRRGSVLRRAPHVLHLLSDHLITIPTPNFDRKEGQDAILYYCCLDAADSCCPSS